MTGKPGAAIRYDSRPAGTRWRHAHDCPRRAEPRRGPDLIFCASEERRGCTAPSIPITTTARRRSAADASGECRTTVLRVAAYDEGSCRTWRSRSPPAIARRARQRRCPLRARLTATATARSPLTSCSPPPTSRSRQRAQRLPCRGVPAERRGRRRVPRPRRRRGAQPARRPRCVPPSSINRPVGPRCPIPQSCDDGDAQTSASLCPTVACRLRRPEHELDLDRPKRELDAAIGRALQMPHPRELSRRRAPTSRRDRRGAPPRGSTSGPRRT